MANGFGTSPQRTRIEDDRLLRGNGRYVDDLTLPGQSYGVVVRSPHAHARIVSIDASHALSAPGVLAVITHADLVAESIGPLRAVPPLKSRDGTDRREPPRPALARDGVRHVGDPVAFVVADTLAQANDAAELLAIDYDPLTAVADATAALAEGAPQLWPDIPANCSFDWETGDRARTDALFAAAHKVVRLSTWNNRLAGNPIETRGVNAAFDRDTGRFTIHTASQGVFSMRRLLAQCFGLAEDRFHVITGDVGGGFGIKYYFYPEQLLCAFAARRTGRPVKWQAQRGESLLSDTHGRDLASTAQMALDADGRMLALRVESVANLGAYLSMIAPVIPTVVANDVLPSVYRIEAVHVRVRGVFTNTVPIDAYRGSGKPETQFLVERLVDIAARATGIERAELRRRNLVPASAMPWTNALGLSIHSGDFPAVLERALVAADWAGAAARKAQSLRQGRRRGIGLACYLESTGGARVERAELRFSADGSIDVLVGTMSTGQGHETAYAHMVARQFDLPLDRVRVVQGDSDRLASGGGTGGSRSLTTGGSALQLSVDRALEMAREEAAGLLEAPIQDLELAGGEFHIAGTDRKVTLAQIVQSLRARAGVADGIAGGLDTTEQVSLKANNYPNGCHVAEVEVDPETGVLSLERYTVVDDFGRVLEPMIVEGQVHGGVAQGIGQALMEQARYDAEAQLVTGSFMDYTMPRAADFPMIDVVLAGIPCTSNPLGVKGAGEAGAVGSPPAVINALVDALADLGVEHIDMPATAERQWRLIHGETAT